MNQNAAHQAEDISPTSSADEDSEIRSLVVAVHGIGNQYRYATVQAVANRFMKRCGIEMTLPLGAFHPVKLIVEPDSPELGAYLFTPPEEFQNDFGGFGFAEVFWADIPERAADTKNTTEESKAWAQTIVDKMRHFDNAKKQSTGRKSDLLDYEKIGTVLLEMIDTIRVIENLLFLAKKAGLFEFKLGQLLTDFLGDVQIVTEYKDYGGNVFSRFAITMENLNRRLKNLEVIYVIAHSEGTVISLIGLLKALGTEEKEKEWPSKVKGLMTIGSPLNKHIVLWPELWKTLKPHPSRTEGLIKSDRQPILWRNYYDFGDPVGFDLSITRDWLENNGWMKSKLLSFGDDNDFGFTRYPFPGVAHNEYWKDDTVFGHFIAEVILDRGKQDRPPTRWSAWIISYCVPYLLCVGLVFGGTYLIYKTFTNIFGQDHKFLDLIRDVSGLTLLIIGITLLGRMPRLDKVCRSMLIGISGFAIGAFGYHYLVTCPTQHSLNSTFFNQDYGLIIAGLLIAAGAALFSKIKPQLGMRPLIGLGGIAALMILWKLMQPDPFSFGKSIWPLVLVNAGFLYLWWLAALLFDLVYVWHVYIRHPKRTIEVLEKLKPSVPSRI
jgi:hypothetical protein